VIASQVYITEASGNIQTKGANMSDIKIVTSPSCHYCVVAKKYLLSRGISFSEIPHTSMPNVRGVPVLVTPAGNFVGWNPGKWWELIQKSGY
jgi:glutaredoxin